MVKMLTAPGIAEKFRVSLAKVFPGRHQKAAGAAGRVADDVLGVGRGEFHHQADDVARGAELAILPSAGNLAQHVFVEVALGIPVLHRDMVEQVHHFGQQRRGGDGKAGILHVMAVGRAIAAHGAQEGEDMLAHDRIQVPRCEVLEAGPAEVLVSPALGVSAFREDAMLQRLIQHQRLALFQRMRVIQASDEQQVGDLFNHLQRVGNAARPEGIPDSVDLAS